MKERPILFKGDMVRAILDDLKTQTRRIVKPAKCRNTPLCNLAPCEIAGEINQGDYTNSPYGQPGDRLWVRETWSDVNLEGAPGVAYRADDDIRDLMAEPCFHDDDGAFNYDDERIKPYGFAVWFADLLSGVEGRWRPSIHMPRWASRITLEIVSVRVERLQDISEEDAIAEGPPGLEFPAPPGSFWATEDGRRNAFRLLWQSINGAESWTANPWVWVVEFKRISA